MSQVWFPGLGMDVAPGGQRFINKNRNLQNRNKDTDVENGRMDMGGGEGG